MVKIYWTYWMKCSAHSFTRINKMDTTRKQHKTIILDTWHYLMIECSKFCWRWFITYAHITTVDDAVAIVVVSEPHFEIRDIYDEEKETWY